MGGGTLQRRQPMLDVLLRLGHVQVVLCDMFCGFDPLALILQPQQRPGMALGEMLLHQDLTALLPQPQQPQLVGKGRGRAAEAGGGLLLGDAGFVNVGGDGGSLFQIVQIPPLEIFHQRQQGRGIVIRPGEDAGHLFQPRQLCRPQPPLPGDQLPALPLPAHRQRLENAVAADGARQLPDALLFKNGAGLVRVGPDVLHRQFHEFFGVFHRVASFFLPFPPLYLRTGAKSGGIRRRKRGNAWKSSGAGDENFPGKGVFFRGAMLYYILNNWVRIPIAQR